MEATCDRESTGLADACEYSLPAIHRFTTLEYEVLTSGFTSMKLLAGYSNLTPVPTKYRSLKPSSVTTACTASAYNRNRINCCGWCHAPSPPFSSKNGRPVGDTYPRSRIAWRYGVPLGPEVMSCAATEPPVTSTTNRS